jgi:hypothetical protein
MKQSLGGRFRDNRFVFFSLVRLSFLCLPFSGMCYDVLFRWPACPCLMRPGLNPPRESGRPSKSPLQAWKWKNGMTMRRRRLPLLPSRWVMTRMDSSHSLELLQACTSVMDWGWKESHIHRCLKLVSFQREPRYGAGANFWLVRESIMWSGHGTDVGA